jgi:SnoaL-like domain
LPVPTEEVLQRIVDEHAILQTISRWCHALDFFDPEMFIDCFTPTGRLIVFTPDRVVQGEVAFRRFLDAHRAGKHIHLAATSKLVLDADRATCDTLVARIDADEQDDPFLYAFGCYHDQLVRGADGTWRIQERFVERFGHSPRTAGPPRRDDP